MSLPLALLGMVAAFVIGVGAAILLGKLRGKSILGTATLEAAQKLSDAEREAAAMIRDAKTDIKEMEVDLKRQMEKEAKESRKEISKVEERVAQKEKGLDKRAETLDKTALDLATQERDLVKKEKILDKEREEVALLKREQISKLESISGLTQEQARKEIYTQLENEVKRDSALELKRVEDELKEEADKRAKWIISEAIQRCASDHVAETTVSVVSLPNDEMKGRIIGREGRNIRALENATGISCIIDDTPEAVILSGFDPIRRQVARITLERLIEDGRIHPARIEEMVEKVNEEMARLIKERGEAAALEVDVHGVHPEMIRLMGRLSFRTSYGQNVLRHSIEVSHLCGLMAAELGVNVQEAKRAGFLHDMGKALTHEVEGTHAVLGHDIAKRHGESQVVCNAIGAHHNEMPQETIIAVLVQAADAMSASRPGARSEQVSNYIKRLEQLEEIAMSFPGVESSFAIQAGREVRVVVEPTRVNDGEAQMLARDIAKKIETEMTYPGQIRVTVVRETRAVELAK